jgi:hypothetical protein
MLFRVPLALALLTLSAPLAVAGQINTGGETGAYHATFCPQVAAALRKNKFDYACTPSQGSMENIQRVVADPAQVGFSQLDAFALETENLGNDKLFTRIRSDVAHECLFMVTKNRGVSNFGQVAAVASQLHFVLPPQKSGSAATFQLLQRIDPQGLGLARNVTYAASVDEALTQAMAADDAVTLFVQFPDPANARFQAIVKGGGNIIPVVDRAILRQEANGEKVYFADETEITPAKWNKSAEKVVTACTPLMLFSGASDRIADANDRKDQDDLVRTIRSLTVEELRPKESALKAFWRKTKALSAQSVEKLMELSDKAREQAKPTVDAAMKKAQEMADEAKKQAADLIEKAKKATDGTAN